MVEDKIATMGSWCNEDELKERCEKFVADVTIKYTPTPWHRNIKPASKYNVVFAGRNTHVARMVCDSLTEDQVEANTDFLITAVNNHEKLLKMVKELLVVVIDQDENLQHEYKIDKWDTPIEVDEAEKLIKEIEGTK